jgi:hypothetical protein
MLAITWALVCLSVIGYGFLDAAFAAAFFAAIRWTPSLGVKPR